MAVWHQIGESILPSLLSEVSDQLAVTHDVGAGRRVHMDLGGYQGLRHHNRHGDAKVRAPPQPAHLPDCENSSEGSSIAERGRS